jgi:hypothetical protein
MDICLLFLHSTSKYFLKLGTSTLACSIESTGSITWSALKDDPKLSHKRFGEPSLSQQIMLHQFDIPYIILTYKAVGFPEFKLTSGMWKLRFLSKTALPKLQLSRSVSNFSTRQAPITAHVTEATFWPSLIRRCPRVKLKSAGVWLSPRPLLPISNRRVNVRGAFSSQQDVPQ